MSDAEKEELNTRVNLMSTQMHAFAEAAQKQMPDLSYDDFKVVFLMHEIAEIQMMLEKLMLRLN